jgi:hypothetical protein
MPTTPLGQVTYGFMYQRAKGEARTELALEKVAFGQNGIRLAGTARQQTLAI